MCLIIADANIIEELSELLTQKNLLFAYPPLNMSRVRISHELDRVRHVSSRDRKRRFTTRLHHVYRLDTLWRAYFDLKRAAAPGVDGVTWQQYGQKLEDNLRGLARRLISRM